MHLSIKIITPERTVFEADDVDYLVAPGTEGDVGILPGHAPFATGLALGEVRVEVDDTSTLYAISGGLLEVVSDRVQVLAQTVEHKSDIDTERAKAARRRAEERLASRDPNVDESRAQAALARAVNRLSVAGAEP